jgi:hypothetical protein
MADIANAAILASLVVGMVSIPAASGSIEAGNSIPEPLDNISSTQNVPQQESTELNTDSFRKTVQTAFSEIRTEIESGSAEGELETPQSRLTFERKPAGVEWRIETSQGKLTVKQKSGKVIERTETPYGTLEKTRENGAVKTSFEGSNRDEVEKVSEELRDLMEQKKKKYRSKTDEMRLEQYRKGIALDVAPETPEKVVIENNMNQKLDLTGWEVANNNPDYFKLNSTLEEDQKLHIYSADSDEVDNEENGSGKYVYGSGLTWEDGGDTAKLFDSEGNEVEVYSYGS